jgi:aryl-alcohol dehydrogenase-like predicted oxidoreductase
MVSRVNFGVGLLGRLKFKLSPVDGGKVLRAAFDLGVNFWDGADFYGTHPHIREGLRGLDRSKVVVNSKTQAKDRATAIADVERFLRELDTPYVDTLMLHGVESVDEFQRRQGALAGLLECKERGLVRHVGMSTHISTGPIMDMAATDSRIEVVLTLYNKDGLMLKGGTLAEHVDAIRRVYEAGKGVCLMKVLAQGDLVPQREDAIKAAVAFPHAHAFTLGFRDAHQVEYAVRLAEGKSVSEELAAKAG